MENNKLHFLRLRRKDSTEPFCDPMADIKVVVQQAFKELPVLYKELFKDEQKADYLKAYLKVFVTRLEEDRTPLLEQLVDFAGAMKSKFSDKELVFFEQMLGKYVLCSFALYQRRDGAVDAKERGAVRAASALLAMQELLSKETLERIRQELPDANKQLERFDSTVSTVDALCVEDKNKTVNNIKDLVAWHMSADNRGWKETAKACDQYISGATDTTAKEIAASLAYPDYDSPYFEIEVEDGTCPETAKT